MSRPPVVDLHASAMVDQYPTSLPPIVSVTIPVMLSSASSWGGFGPPMRRGWGWVMWSVVAPLHDTSTNLGRLIDGAARCG